MSSSWYFEEFIYIYHVKDKMFVLKKIQVLNRSYIALENDFDLEGH